MYIYIFSIVSRHYMNENQGFLLSLLTWYQSQGRKPNSFQFPRVINSGHLPVTVFHSGHLPQPPKLSGRSNRRQKTFTAGDFSGELSRRRLFPTPQGAPGGDLQFFPKHWSQKTTHAPATRVFLADDCISHTGV